MVSASEPVRLYICPVALEPCIIIWPSNRPPKSTVMDYSALFLNMDGEQSTSVLRRWAWFRAEKALWSKQFIWIRLCASLTLCYVFLSSILQLRFTHRFVITYRLSPLIQQFFMCRLLQFCNLVCALISVSLYADKKKKIVAVRPGITDGPAINNVMYISRYWKDTHV